MLRRPKAFGLATLLLLAAATSTPSRSQAQAQPHKLRFSLGLTLAIDAPALAGFVLLESFVPPPERCRLCAVPALDAAISDALGSPKHRWTAATLSDLGLWGSWLGGATLALLGGAAEHRFGSVGWTRGAEDIAIVAEAALTTALVVDVIKLAAARRRPDQHFAIASGRRRNESLVSGHSAQAATLATASTAVVFLRDYAFKLAVPVTGAALALTVGVLRIVALRHWATDVLAGWAVGAAVGMALPLLLHPRIGEPTNAAGVAPPADVTLPLWSGAW